jgi:hypothetical protein
VTGRVAWIRSPAVDVSVALAWVPFAVVAVAVAGDADRLRQVAGGVLLLSFIHQPVTLPLAYGDADQRAAHRRLFAVAPIAAFIGIFAGLHLSLLGVGLIASLWNAHHTVRQRYGLVRIYGRKVGQDDGTGEQALLFSWFGMATVAALANPRLADGLGALPLGAVNGAAVDTLDRLRPIAALALVAVVPVVIAVTIMWARRELARPTVNPAKHLYLAGTALLFAFALVEPVAGLLAYVGAHAVEYLVIVHGALGTRYGADERTALGRAVRSPFGRTGFLVIYIGLVLIVVNGVEAFLPLLVFKAAFLTFGLLHFVYDAVIWKLRRPAVAATFAIPVAAAPS